MPSPRDSLDSVFGDLGLASQAIAFRHFVTLPEG